MLTQLYYRRDNKNMDDNMNNRENENENVESSFGSSEYYKKLYNDFPEDVAEMLIGTHPLMKKEVSEELTHSIKIKSAREKNRRAVSENLENEEETAENSAAVNDAESVSASKDPVERNEEPEEEAGIDDYVGDITNFTKGLVTPSSKRQRAESAPAKEEKDDAPKSEDDITAEKVARMLGGVDVEPVDEDEYDDFEEPEYEEKPKKKVKKEEKQPRKKKQRRNIEEKDLELSNIDKQASLNELFREDDDYYEEKHSGNSVVRIVIVVAAIVVLAFFIYKVASLSGQVSKLNEQVESYKTMETEYEQLKLDNLSLTEQVENLQAQLGGGTTEGTDTTETTTNNTTTGSSSTGSSTNTGSSSTTASSNSGARTYTVQAGDTYWGIATKMYGNGSYYEKILSANGLTEKDTIREGMTLTIPAA